MDKEMHPAERPGPVARGRERAQGTALVCVVTPLLAVGAAYPALHAAVQGTSLEPWLAPLLLSVAFAALVLTLKAATHPAAAIGSLVCMTISQPRQADSHLHASTLLALLVLFVLTFLATRFGRAKKESRRLAERRSGRRSSQIVANLGVAALCGAMGWYTGCIAALAEAAADTVSSEIGQAVAGQAWLITTARKVPAGTDGGITPAGTITGIIAAALVAATATIHQAHWPIALLAFAAACAGLLVDSLLGATVERRGWLGNDLVNFSSTLFAALIAIAFGKNF